MSITLLSNLKSSGSKLLTLNSCNKYKLLKNKTKQNKDRDNAHKPKWHKTLNSTEPGGIKAPNLCTPSNLSTEWST